MTVRALPLSSRLPARLVMAAGDLFIYTWGEYTPPDLVTKFEKEFDVKVHIDTFDSMETMLAKLRSGAGGYDIVVAGDATVQVMVAENMIEKIDVNAMPNYANVDDKWKDVYWDKGRSYSAPWAWGSTAIIVDTAQVKGDLNTLSVLFNPADNVKGKINMLRDMNDVINMAQRYLGLPRCNDKPEDMAKVLDLLETQKAWVKSYNSEFKEPMVSGEAIASMGWNGYSMRAREEKPTLAYVYPKEGYTGWMDNLVVPKGAPDMDNAKAFVNFMMAPENAAMVTNYARYSMPDAPVDSWAMVFDPRIAAKFADCGIAMLDDSEQVLGSALIYLGLDPDTESEADLEKAVDVIKAVRPYVRQFHGSNYIAGLAAGDLCLAVGYSGDMLVATKRATEAGKAQTIEYRLPKEGNLVWFDTLAIPADAPNPTAAHAFVNFVMRPEIAAKAANDTGFSTANLAALPMVDEAIRSNPNYYPSPEAAAKFHLPSVKSEAMVKIWDRAWNRAKGVE